MTSARHDSTRATRTITRRHRKKTERHGGHHRTRHVSGADRHSRRREGPTRKPRQTEVLRGQPCRPARPSRQDGQASEEKGPPTHPGDKRTPHNRQTGQNPRSAWYGQEHTDPHPDGRPSRQAKSTARPKARTRTKNAETYRLHLQTGVTLSPEKTPADTCQERGGPKKGRTTVESNDTTDQLVPKQAEHKRRERRINAGRDVRPEEARHRTTTPAGKEGERKQSGRTNARTDAERRDWPTEKERREGREAAKKAEGSTTQGREDGRARRNDGTTRPDEGKENPGRKNRQGQAGRTPR